MTAAKALAMSRQGHRIIGARSQSEIGLASSPKPFRCGDCRYYERDPANPKIYKEKTCFNPNPKLYEEHVEPVWCCNLYDHPGMRVIK